MKRIAMISYHTCPLAHEEEEETGGMNIYVLELSRRLAELGGVVDVFTRSQDPQAQEIVQVAHGLRVIHINAGPQKFVPTKQLFPYIDQFAGEVMKFCTRHQVSYDIFHAHYYLSGLIAQKMHKRFVMSFHTLGLMKNLVARSVEEKELDFRIEAETSLMRSSDAIVSPSESDANYMQYLYGADRNSIHIVPPGVDTKLFRPRDMTRAKKHINVPVDHKMILFVGRIEALKGIDVLLYALKIISARNPALPLCLCVVGAESKTSHSLSALRSMLGLTQSVTFIPQQTQEELVHFYNAAEIVVMPSHYESFGMVALESMACGVPVITTNVAGIASFLDDKHSQLISTVNNPLLLARQMEKLLLDETKRSLIGTQLRKKVLDLTWTKIAKRVDEVYDHVL